MTDHGKYPPTPPDCVNDFPPSFLPHTDEEDSDIGIKHAAILHVLRSTYGTVKNVLNKIFDVLSHEAIRIMKNSLNQRPMEPDNKKQKTPEAEIDGNLDDSFNVLKESCIGWMKQSMKIRRFPLEDDKQGDFYESVEQRIFDKAMNDIDEEFANNADCIVKKMKLTLERQAIEFARSSTKAHQDEDKSKEECIRLSNERFNVCTDSINNRIRELQDIMIEMMKNTVTMEQNQIKIMY